MSNQDSARSWDEAAANLAALARAHGEKLSQLFDLCLQMAQMREADKLVIEQLGATVEVFDARIAMLSAKLDELEARLNGD